MKHWMRIFGMVVFLATMLFVVSGVAEGGTFRGLDWDLTDGVLTLGKDNETQNVTVNSISVNTWPWYDYSTSIISVVSKGNLVFHGDLNYTFYGCSNLQSVDTSNWDTSDVTRMVYLFGACDSLSSLDLSGFDTSNVTRMFGMFKDSTGLVSLNVSGWNTSIVTDMGSMFYNCSQLTSLDLSGFDVSHVVSTSRMFSGCTSLTTIGNVDSWRFLAATDASHMFSNCSNLASLACQHWVFSSRVQTVSMFDGCNALSSLNVSDWDMSNTYDIMRMFSDCDNLVSITGLENWHTSNVTRMTSLFCDCDKLQTVDLTGWDIGSVTNLSSVFGNCEALVSVGNISNWNTSGVTNMSYLFDYCKSLPSLNLSGWDTSHVTNMHYMFRMCSNLTSITGIENWDVSQVTDMESIFDTCKKLQVDVGDWNTSNVTKMAKFFYCCWALESLNLSNFDTSGATSMSNMYYACWNLSSVMLGDGNPFVGANGASAVLPTPPDQKDGVYYTGKWIRKDKTYGPYTPEELRDNYVSAMAGEWVWRAVVQEYTISFVSSVQDVVGSMPQVTVVVDEAYALPENAFVAFGKAFSFWRDNNTGNTYVNTGVIPANTYAANVNVVLTAYFTDRDTSVIMQDGAFEFSIQGDEKALFENIPVGTSYQVYEQLPEDWVLIYQENSTGLIYPLEESMAIFLNKYQPDITTVQFTGRKLYDDQPALKDQFEFELWEGNILLQTKSTLNGGFFQFDAIEFDKNDVGAHYYTIKEKIGTDDRLLYDGHEEQVTVEIYTEPGETEDVVKVRSRVTYSGDSVLFKNWTKPGELTLKKLVDDLMAEHESDQFTFRITFKQENGLPLEEAVTYIIR